VSGLLVAATAVVSAAVLLPHLIPLHKVAPPVGIVLWLLALTLRAVSAVALATLALVGLAEVPVVEAALAWCWHALLPDVPGALGFEEHPVSHAAVAVPAAVLAGSLAWLAARVARGTIALRRLLARQVGAGPLGSTVIHDDRVVLALTGFGRGRVLVSDRALGELDDDELAAGLMHEHAHLRRLHRPVLVTAAVLGAVGRPLPGTRAAERELRFQLERDADQYTVRRLRDPLALASAICKAAGAAPAGAVASLGGRGPVTLRLEELLDGEDRRSVSVERTAWALVALLGCVIAALVASAPAWGFEELGRTGAHGTHECEHTG
jgi:Zn-dependent protease with chaperone function